MLKKIEIDVGKNRGTKHYRFLWFKWERPFKGFVVSKNRVTLDKPYKNITLQIDYMDALTVSGEQLEKMCKAN